MKEISTTEQSVHSPPEILVDCYGTPITRGATVAFNYCGHVRKGIIEGVRTKWEVARPSLGAKQWWYSKFLLEVKNEDENISKIKNPNSFFIIK